MADWMFNNTLAEEDEVGTMQSFFLTLHLDFEFVTILVIIFDVDAGTPWRECNAPPCHFAY